MDEPTKIIVKWNGSGRYSDFIRLRKEMREWCVANLTDTTFISNGFEFLFAYEQDVVAFKIRFPNDLYTDR